MGSRPSTFKGAPYKDRSNRVYTRKRGRKRLEEKALVTDLVVRNNGQVSPEQIKALATVTERTPAAIRKWIIQARQEFLGSASFYVEVHKEAVRKALEAGTDDSLQVATKGAQWAIEHLGDGDQRIVDRESSGEGSGVKVMIGVKIGGLTDAV